MECPLIKINGEWIKKVKTAVKSYVFQLLLQTSVKKIFITPDGVTGVI